MFFKLTFVVVANDNTHRDLVINNVLDVWKIFQMFLKYDLKMEVNKGINNKI